MCSTLFQNIGYLLYVLLLTKEISHFGWVLMKEGAATRSVYSVRFFFIHLKNKPKKKHCPESRIFDAILLFLLLKFSVLWAAVHIIAIYFYYFNIPQILPTLLHLQEELRLLLWHQSSQIPALAAFLVGYSLHQYRFVKLELKMLLLVVGRHNKRNRTEFPHVATRARGPRCVCSCAFFSCCLCKR